MNGSAGVVVPFFRQSSTNGGYQSFVSVDATWKDSVLALQHNPVTGRAWTVADVNASMEFGFVAPSSAYSPRVPQAYVEVKYRVPASSTDYVGGIYEKQNDGTETKYYDAGGATAMRVETTAGGALETGANCQNTTDDDGDTIVNDGCPMHLRSDHLGGTTKVLNASGAIVSELKYWPYGAVRSGGVTQTDKLYTGQQQEQGDSALGLYNYKARFYSTTLGRFTSADTIVPGLATSSIKLNRYAYGAASPVTYSDPSGHCVQRPDGSWMTCGRQDMVRFFSCAWGGACAGGDDVRRYAAGVVDSDAFKYFVGIESRWGDILLDLTFAAEIKGAGRHVLPELFGDDLVGTVTLQLRINATQRSFISARGAFEEGVGLLGPVHVFDRWRLKQFEFTEFGDKAVELFFEGGPQAGGNWIEKYGACGLNPFACSGYEGELVIQAAFDSAGHFSIGTTFDQTGGPLPVVNGNLPLFDIPTADRLLAVSRTSITVEEVFNEKLVR